MTADTETDRDARNRIARRCADLEQQVDDMREELTRARDFAKVATSYVDTVRMLRDFDGADFLGDDAALRKWERLLEADIEWRTRPDHLKGVR